MEKRQPAPTSYNTILPEIVPNAIYVGDLPYDIDQNTLLLIFSHYGRISTVEVRKTQKSQSSSSIYCH
jgi:RNA recognition motif-containing protein